MQQYQQRKRKNQSQRLLTLGKLFGHLHLTFTAPALLRLRAVIKPLFGEFNATF